MFCTLFRLLLLLLSSLLRNVTSFLTQLIDDNGLFQHYFNVRIFLIEWTGICRDIPPYTDIFDAVLFFLYIYIYIYNFVSRILSSAISF